MLVKKIPPKHFGMILQHPNVTIPTMTQIAETIPLDRIGEVLANNSVPQETKDIASKRLHSHQESCRKKYEDNLSTYEKPEPQKTAVRRIRDFAG